MLESQRSSRENYDVSTPELDALIDIVMRHGALGARLTGAGFGGAIVALVEESFKSQWEAAVEREYPGARIY